MGIAYLFRTLSFPLPVRLNDTRCHWKRYYPSNLPVEVALGLWDRD